MSEFLNDTARQIGKREVKILIQIILKSFPRKTEQKEAFKAAIKELMEHI